MRLPGIWSSLPCVAGPSYASNALEEDSEGVVNVDGREARERKE